MISARGEPPFLAEDRIRPECAAPPMTGRAWLKIALAIVLASYWISMFVGTHLPRMPQAFEGQSDKVLHLVGYGGLAVCLLANLLLSRQPTLRNVALLWLLIGGYGVFDEVTQPFVGRHCDIEDWFADMTGGAAGLLLLWLCSRLLMNRSRS